MTEQNNMGNRDVKQEKEYINSLLRRIRREAQECVMKLGLPEQAGYDVLAVIHGQAFMSQTELPTPFSAVAASEHRYPRIEGTTKEIGQLLGSSGSQVRPPDRLAGVHIYDDNYSLVIDQSLDQMSLRMLVEHCTQEVNKYRHGEPSDERYGLEILRRAVVLREEEAWATLQRQFTENVRYWFARHTCRDAALRYETEQDYIDHAFQRFWQAVSDQALAFTSLAAALRYLRLCLHCAVMDTLRVFAHPRLVALPEQGHPEEPQVEDQYDESGDLWKVISNLMANERERRVAYLHFHCNLKPREIMRLCPDEFSGEEEIYRIKRNIMERIMRNIDKIRWRLS